MLYLPDVEQESFVVVYPFQNWWCQVAIEGSYCVMDFLKQNYLVGVKSCICSTCFLYHFESVMCVFLATLDIP